MTSLSETSLLSGAAGQSTGYTIDQSILFNDDDSAYMSRTFSASNRKTFTVSLWAKRGNLNSNMNMFGPETNNTGSGTYGYLRFPSGDTLEFADYTNGTTNWLWSSSIAPEMKKLESIAFFKWSISAASAVTLLLTI